MVPARKGGDYASNRRGAERMRARELLSSPEACNGCGECRTACMTINGAGEGPAVGIQIARLGLDAVPVLCRNCDDAPCVSACMPGCRYRDEATGRVLTDYERCVGCWMCVMLCPFGAIQRVPARPGSAHGVAFKCDGCTGEEQAPCAEACSRGAVREISPRDLATEKRVAAARKFGAGE